MLVYYLQMLDTPEEKVRFEQIYLKYRGLMYHVAEDILHNRQDAEDAVHNAFCESSKNFPGFRTLRQRIWPRRLRSSPEMKPFRSRGSRREKPRWRIGTALPSRRSPSATTMRWWTALPGFPGPTGPSWR